jgi:UDP-N-acetylmuramoylalanine--D-glutamate ligase
VIKNILPDHLNYYKTMEKYIQDKKYIFSNQKPKDWLVANGDDETVREIVKDAKAKLVSFSYQPSAKQDQTVFIENENIYINDGIDVKKLIATKDISIPGRHNLSNVMAAIGAAYAYGLSFLEIKKALPELSGPAHRLEFVRNLNDVKYYNDTTSTTPEATIAALRALSSSPLRRGRLGGGKNIVLIAGGSDKGLDFKVLTKEIKKNCKATVLLNDTGTKRLIKPLLADKKLPVTVADTMSDAVGVAKSFAKKGDIILLSPACASFGLFKNEFDRGNQFRRLVKKIK